MSWQVEDADANRQGLTIAELGELGGPGMGGCPAGPSDQAAPTSSYAVARSADRSRLAVTWAPASALARRGRRHRLQRRAASAGVRPAA